MGVFWLPRGVDVALDLATSFRYPLNDPDAKKKLALGGACFFPGILLLAIPFVVLGGYGISAMRKVIKGEEDELPEWELMADHFRFGLMALLIFLGYYAVPFLVTVFTIGGSLISLLGTRAADGSTSVGIWFILGTILAGLIGLAIYFILPMAILNYATTDELGSGFAVGNIIEKITSNLQPYVVVVLVNLAIGTVCSIPLNILSNLPLIGILGLFFGGVLCTYGMLVQAHVTGTFYRETFGSHVGASTNTTEGTGLEAERWKKDD